MIDTIILTIPKEKFITFKDDTSLAWNLNSKIGFFEKYVKNQTARQKQDGIYRPRISLIKRGLTEVLKIEFSIPKLIYGNNVDEVKEEDFNNILEKLKERLKDFNVAIEIDTLKNSQVSAFHPSKNILLSNQYTAKGVIKELSKINLTRKMELTKQTFTNEGESLQMYSNAHSFVIYDKIADIRKPKGRAIDKERTIQQISLFKELHNQEEILRFEVRLSKKVKMNSVLMKLGYKKNPTFQEIFKKETCQKIVEMYWKDLILNENLFLFSLSNGHQETLKRMIKKHPETKPKQMIYFIGLKELCKGAEGIKDFRRILEYNSSNRTWQRISEDIKILNNLYSISDCHNWVSQIESQIDEFEALKIYDLLCKEK